MLLLLPTIIETINIAGQRIISNVKEPILRKHYFSRGSLSHPKARIINYYAIYLSNNASEAYKLAVSSEFLNSRF
jgi:hypothetical protein